MSNVGFWKIQLGRVVDDFKWDFSVKTRNLQQMTKRSMCWPETGILAGVGHKNERGTWLRYGKSHLFGVGEGWAPCDKEVTIVSHRPYLQKPPPKNGHFLQQCSTKKFNVSKDQA
jgi:hypothetical protein